MGTLFKRTHMCGTLNISNVGQDVVLNGWVAKRRNLGGLIFVDLRDKTGIVQVTFDDKIPKELFDARALVETIGTDKLEVNGQGQLLQCLTSKEGASIVAIVGPLVSYLLD